ncbi:MAG: hypothetical protein C0506_02645 [Anaerolinea sp.]|nr:hypothetical protein [Anaerolinea sp.]
MSQSTAGQTGYIGSGPVGGQSGQESRLAREFRQATPADAPAVRRIFSHEPSAERLGLADGDPRRAARLQELFGRVIAGKAPLSRTIVAAEGSEVVGFMQAGGEGGASLANAWGVLRIFGPRGIRGFLRRERARSRVHMAAPAGTYHIAELHVDANRRNQGIGAALLAETGRIARAQAFALMSLTTTTTNPARHLYERSGFEVIETRTDPEYQAITGIDGRVLMVKRLE